MISYSPHVPLKSALQLSPPVVPLKKSVSFQSILIREYSRDVDVNPSVSSGPAMGFGWNFQDRPAYDLETFEENRPPHRSRAELKMSHSDRVFILQDHGVTRSDIQSSIRSINIAKRQRQASLAKRVGEHLILARERVRRKVGKLTKCRGRRKVVDIGPIPSPGKDYCRKSIINEYTGEGVPSRHNSDAYWYGCGVMAVESRY
jgi:hypothetical protein